MVHSSTQSSSSRFIQDLISQNIPDTNGNVSDYPTSCYSIRQNEWGCKP
jgi:hypothetical protein